MSPGVFGLGVSLFSLPVLTLENEELKQQRVQTLLFDGLLVITGFHVLNVYFIDTLGLIFLIEG